MSWYSDCEKPSKWYLYHSGDADAEDFGEDEPAAEVVDCNACVHFDVCEFANDDEYADEESLKADCPHFKSKADFVNVIRCKDCDIPHNKWLGCPNLNGLIPPPDFYCARGERKDGDGE